MTPAEIGYETGRPELGDVRPADADPRDPGGLEDVVHTGRVVERQVVERGDDTVVDHLTGARHLTVGVALAVAHVRLELGVSGTDAAALVERRDRREHRILHLRS